MDNITSSIITPVVQSLLVPVKKHLGFLVSSTKYVKDMKEKMDQLILTEQDIRREWDEAVARNHEVSHHVSPWLEKVQNLNEKVQSIPTGGIGCFNMTKRYRAGKQCYNITEEIQALEKWKSKIVFTKAQKPLAVVVSTTGPSTSAPISHGTLTNFESRELIFKAALKSLQPDNESEKMIALSGMGGVGKTTMTEQLKKEVEASQIYDRVVKVVVGENANPIALQSAIAEYIGEDLTETTKDARADHLCKIFQGMSQQAHNKILVIMDDIWKPLDLKDVGLSPLPNGFKLFFTSRYESVCTHMGVRINSLFKVGFLNGAEAKALFFRIVGLSDGDDPTLQKIGEDIVKKCSGLPIAIVTIAKSLSGNIEEAWKKALWRLEKDDLKDLESITQRIFYMSYENLKEDEDKAVFLLSGLFPDDFDIRREDLLRYGWGLGFFKDVKTLANARSHMKICVNNLISANLLTESEHMGCVKMHDLVRAFVLSNFSQVKQASIVNHDNESEERLTKFANESYDRILLKCTGMTKFPTDFNYPNLSMLMLMDGYKILKFPKHIYKRMEKLEVMSYEKMHIPFHPGTFEHSTKLRTLCLRSCSLINDEISFLGSLRNLEILSFVNCEISRLPSPIGKLKKLKLLHLTGCVDLHIDDGVFQNLGSLEELYMRAFNNSPIRFTDANSKELEILSPRLFALELQFFENEAQLKSVSFKKLERFRISIGCKLVDLEHDEENSFRNTIKFVGDYNELLESQISDLFEKTEELYLTVNGMNHLKDVSMCHSFFNLRVLGVYKIEGLTYLFTVDVAGGLKKLERLTISKCHGMRALVAENSGVRVIRFQKLNYMYLKDLPNMIYLWDNVMELPEMVELILDDLPNFTSIYPPSYDTSQMKSLLNQKVVIPKLDKLDISRMENLKHIWSFETTTEKHNVSMLRKISVTECDNLMNLFPSNPLPLLNHLENLVVAMCGSIEVLFSMDFESICGIEESNSSRSLRSITVKNLGKLQELWRMKGVNNCDIHINCFKGVESIEIRDCSIFKNVFTPTTAKFDLSSLTHYIIHDTGEEINAILKGEIVEMDNYIPNVTYPSYLLQKCHQLQHLDLWNDGRVEEVVFDMDTQPPLLLPYLEDIKLDCLKKMTHMWKCNWNKFLIPQHQPLQFPFQNLTNISLKNCHKIKYLFSPFMAKFLSNLMYAYIQECDGIEEVVSWRDDENEENAFPSSEKNTTLFPKLETLYLEKLTLLERIDGADTRSRSDTVSSDSNHDQSQRGQVIGACLSLCQYPTNIYILNCDVLSSLIPWYAVGQMKRLKELEISYCEKMVEVFESETSTNNGDEESACGAPTCTTLTCLTLKNITNVVPQLSNLKSVFIYKCDLLSHVFTFSTLQSLEQLKELTINKCKEIQVIVKEEAEMSSKDVVLPLLETLILDDLPSLKGFFLGMNEFRWPALDNVEIKDCPQLMMFTSGESKTPKLKYIHTTLGKHSLECGLKFHGTINEYQATFPPSYPTITKGIPCFYHNLTEINISYKDDGETIIPSHALLQLQKLQKIYLLRSNKVKEIFEVASEGSDFNESQTIVKIPNLRQVNLEWAHGLTYLWKSTQWMVLEFPNLTTVSIVGCHSLEHVFTCSMVGSLVQLQDLRISYCDNIEVIVKEEEEKKQCEVKVFEIVLPSLKSLKLGGLPSLKGFCLGMEDFSWPLLDTMHIDYCPEITVFTKGYLSTPELKVIDTSFGMCSVKTDLNSFIKTKQEEGYEF